MSKTKGKYINKGQSEKYKRVFDMLENGERYKDIEKEIKVSNQTITRLKYLKNNSYNLLKDVLNEKCSLQGAYLKLKKDRDEDLKETTYRTLISNIDEIIQMEDYEYINYSIEKYKLENKEKYKKLKKIIGE